MIIKSKKLSNPILRLGLLVMITWSSSSLVSGQTLLDSITFNSLVPYQTFVVPDCVFQLEIEAHGASGGDALTNASILVAGKGGYGGLASGIINVTPGETLYVVVGGAGGYYTGGFNGGGTGGNSPSSNYSGGGGGATDVRRGGTSLNDRILVAGGGGGGGASNCYPSNSPQYGNGGDGNGLPGQNGAPSPSGGPGFGGTLNNPGLKGIGCSGYLGTDGTAGSLGQGGNGGMGQTCCCSTSNPNGGGGGGGYYGGGGGGGGSAGTTGCIDNDKGGGGGGAGGSSYNLGMDIPGTLGVTTKRGNGVVYIYATGNLNAHIISTSDTICSNDFTSVYYTGISNNLMWSVSGGLEFFGSNTDSIAIITGTSSGYVYLNYNTCLLDSQYIHVKTPSESVSFFNPTNPSLCVGDSIDIIAVPSGGTFTLIQGPSSDLVNSTLKPSELITYEVEYSTLSSNGCEIKDSISFTIECTLSEEVNQLNANISLFPNPNFGNFTLNSSEALEGELKILDMQGKLVYIKTLNGAKSWLIEPSLPSGVYVLNITNNKNQTYTSKLQIVK